MSEITESRIRELEEKIDRMEVWFEEMSQVVFNSDILKQEKCSHRNVTSDWTYDGENETEYSTCDDCGKVFT
jgi:hypothetical protein